MHKIQYLVQYATCRGVGNVRPNRLNGAWRRLPTPAASRQPKTQSPPPPGREEFPLEAPPEAEILRRLTTYLREIACCALPLSCNVGCALEEQAGNSKKTATAFAAGNGKNKTKNGALHIIVIIYTRTM